jgi:AcrR family transcriptional regulator
MPSRPSRPALRERYERRRQDVVQAAARVFAERGYEQTSVQQLAAELELATGALYHYFPGKEDLLIEICDQLMSPLLERIDEMASAPGPPAQRLRDLVRLWVGHVIEHRDHVLVFQQVRHVVDHGEQWRDVRRDRKEFEERLDAVLAGVGVASLATADRDLARYALLGMVNHTVQWYRPRGRLSAVEIADGYVDLVLAREP